MRTVASIASHRRWLTYPPSPAPHPTPGQDGAAFLLERRGDVASALRIHIKRLDAANRHLAAAVREGRLDLAAAAAQSVAGGGGGGSAARLHPAGAPPAGPAVALMRQRRPSAQRGTGDAAAAAAVAALLDASAAQPPELRAARDALAAAVAMCLRREGRGERGAGACMRASICSPKRFSCIQPDLLASLGVLHDPLPSRRHVVAVQVFPGPRGAGRRTPCRPVC